MGRGVRRGGSSGGEEWEGKGLSRVYTAPAYLQPQEEGGREGMDRGMDRNACRREEEKDLLEQQNSSRLTAQRATPLQTVGLCMCSHWTGVHWTCF